MGKIQKKGDLTAKQIVIILLLIAAFVIILILYWRFGFSENIDKESCHQSIVMRSTFNYGPFEVGKNVIQLECRTEKICISKNGEDCEEFGKSTRKNPVLKKEVNTIDEVLDAYADSMYDCNWMLGEGKLDFMPHKHFEENYCLICSRIAFSPSAKQDFERGIMYGQIYKRLQERKTTNGKSYLEYIYPGWRNWETSKDLFETMKKESSNEEFKKVPYQNWSVFPQQEGGYIILAQMTPAGDWDKWVKVMGVAGGALVAVVGAALIPVSGPIGVAIVVAGTKLVLVGAVVAGGAIYVYDHPSNEYKWAPPTILPYDAGTLKSLKCSSFEIAP